VGLLYLLDRSSKVGLKIWPPCLAPASPTPSLRGVLWRAALYVHSSKFIHGNLLLINPPTGGVRKSGNCVVRKKSSSHIVVSLVLRAVEETPIQLHPGVSLIYCIPSNAVSSAKDLNFDTFFLMISYQGEQLSI
jgi:hypothetical protein